MPYYDKDPKRDHNFDNHPCRFQEPGSLNKSYDPDANIRTLRDRGSVSLATKKIFVDIGHPLAFHLI